MSHFPTESDQIERSEVYTVSQLNRRARQLLEVHFPLIWVEGEISNISFPPSGHWYFSLKDEAAQVRCAMFKARNKLAGFQPKNGQHLLIRARVGLYENRGEFQLIVEHVEDAGHGRLQRRFDLLKAKLHREGLFDPQHKQPLPTLPSRIGVVTSPSGAAIHDILTVLKRRFAAIPVTVYPCTVQGAEAPASIASAIALANADNRCDALIVGRGGGSIEDLWAFNEEAVARAIFASKIPLISAVGHEVDVTIADFVADIRAATPSAAAEMLAPDSAELLADFKQLERQLQQTLTRLLHGFQQRVDHLQRRLRHPGERLQQQRQQLNLLQQRLQRQMDHAQRDHRAHLDGLITRLHGVHPMHQLEHYQRRIDALRFRLNQTIKNQLQQKQARWQALAHLLHAVSPLPTLERGYAIVSDEQKQLLRTVASVTTGDKISARLSDGELLCRIEAINMAKNHEKF